MKVTYSPEDGEQQVFEYNPNKLLSAEREALEKRTGRPFNEFAMGVLRGNSLCRRALLHVLLKRQHPTIRFDDVDFCWDELTVEMTKGEIELAVEHMRAKGGDEDLIEGMLADLDSAPEDEGKARLPFAV
ncbi:hypothetical protein [Streptomyces sp. WMMC897]|uniref:hypothetical protein n=1 Tax=Streptomyces sp. WMMC897 TaxID=3014782 RepID=UPI0022B60BAE|nr:hypothetical protein [Streptomyces sp. WMMC897]MCZ7413036.1 hypothetical protein [Streptomyces sp. WMMC897]MCZ7413082.1 hypothetical protein [Streptomyces sp. WMMC897]MCZ7415446.1 hypothetical protein [Streptomyces sp. WMMC897]